jgi:hypothetical protein
MNFKDNPFWILGASPRDSKRVLHDKAENKSFEMPEDVCRNAENVLITPKKRLEAEVSWFPGLSPKKINELLAQVEEDAQNGNYDSVFFWDFENLVHANALALLISNISVADLTKECIKEIIEDFCIATSDLDEEEILVAINEDRVASGFAEVSYDALEQELQNIHHLYKQILHAFMDKIDSLLLVEVLTALIEEATAKGEDECEWGLLDNIISDYEVDVISFFEKQEELIESDIRKITDIIEKNPSSSSLSVSVEKLERDVHLWDKIAQPIQVSYKSKGLEHKRSSLLAKKIRELSIAVYNKHELVALSERISRLLLDVFAEVPLIAETVSEDLEFLITSGKDKKKIEAIKKITKKYDVVPTSAVVAKDKFQRCWNEVIPLVNDLYDTETGKNYLASFFLHYVIEYSNHQKDFATCIEILEKVRPLITDKKLLSTFDRNASIIKQNLHIKKAQVAERWDMVKIYGVMILIFGIIGAFIGGCDRHGDAGEGFLGGLGVGVVLSVIGLLQNLGRR